ncbi:hypothetical protein HY642_07375 [Candidatus Woesearchaeota archaeon]|nr:hypothetical protein [Candidatus Woesearchaeota archaeon]
MNAVTCDTRGRIVLPIEVREALGERFVVVPAHDEVVLIPVPNDPVKQLALLGRKAGIGRKSLRELKRAIRKEAEEESVRRH